MVELVTLTMNPAIDISTSVDEIAPTSKLRCVEVKRSPGGGGINVARVLQRLGHKVVAVYPAGGPTGERLRHLLDAEGITSLVVPLAEETRESFTALERRSGAEYRFVLPGPPFSAAEIEAVLSALTGLESAPDMRFVILSGSLPETVPRDFYARATRIAKGFGAKVVVDTFGDALAATLAEGGISLIKPSLRELSELLRAPLGSQEERLAACRGLIADGGVELVALTLGGEGAMLVGRNFAVAATAVQVDVKSAVGAGDSFLGAMVARLVEGKGPVEAFRAAVAAGSAALLVPGTALCQKADVERLTAEVAIREIA